MNIAQLQDELKELTIEKKLFNKQLDSKLRQHRIGSGRIFDLEEVRYFYTSLSKAAQTKAQEHIENLVTLSLQMIYSHPYTFHLIFEQKKNTVSCIPIIKDGDKEYSPKDSMGGGVLDIVGFTLRIILWSMQGPTSRNIFILDEPFRYCGSLSLKAALMLKRLSTKLNFQVILVTHDKSLSKVCDRVWLIKNKKVRRLKYGDNTS